MFVYPQLDIAVTPKTGRKVVHATADISKVKRSKVNVTRSLNAVTENQPYFRNGKVCRSPRAGPAAGGAYRGGHTNGSTAYCVYLDCKERR